MDSQLDIEFDVIVLGTGVTESLVASACARVGKKVLHLDQNEYYGSNWASLSLSSIQKWVNNINHRCQNVDLRGSNIASENEEFLQVSPSISTYFNVSCQWDIPAQDNILPDEEPLPNDVEQPGLQKEEVIKTKHVFSRGKLEKESRKFNIDLSPKVIYARGPMVELFISSNTSKYLEFKCISRILVSRADDYESDPQNGLVLVPCSRSDVFTSEAISLIEKRILMKFLEFCSTYDLKREEWIEFSDQPLENLLRFHKLSPKLIRFVCSAIASVSETEICSEGLKRIKLFLTSLGIYGRLPFLFPLFGAGEIPQAFCRLSAVFEGIYMLHREVDGILFSEIEQEGSPPSKTAKVLCGDQKFIAKNVVSFHGYLQDSVSRKFRRKTSLSRAIFLTNRSLLCNGESEENCSVVHFPSSNMTDRNAMNVTAIELSSGAAVCPPGTYLVHLVCRGEDAEKDFKMIRHSYFLSPDNVETNSNGNLIQPTILFSVYFNQAIYDFEKENKFSSALNLFLCSGPDQTQDYENAINEAKDIFHLMFPGEQFLPRAPDPNDLIFD